MSRRAETVESTRRRIVQAALGLYRKQGIKATAVKQVAERADVSRATVLNHFGGADGLAAAAIESIAASLSLPTAAIYASAANSAERLRRLVTALFTLYDRSEPWFYALREEMGSVPALRRREQRFWADMNELYAAALGPLRRNRRLMATVVGLTTPPTLEALRQAGLSTEESARVVGDLLAGLAQSRREGWENAGG